MADFLRDDGKQRGSAHAQAVGYLFESLRSVLGDRNAKWVLFHQIKYDTDSA